MGDNGGNVSKEGNEGGNGNGVFQCVVNGCSNKAVTYYHSPVIFSHWPITYRICRQCFRRLAELKQIPNERRINGWQR